MFFTSIRSVSICLMQSSEARVLRINLSIFSAWVFNSVSSELSLRPHTKLLLASEIQELCWLINRLVQLYKSESGERLSDRSRADLICALPVLIILDRKVCS